MKRSAFLLGVGVCLLVFGPLAVKAAEDELRVLQLENARLRATLATRDKQVEDLKTEIAGLRTENTKLAAQLKALDDQMKILKDDLATANARLPAEKTTSPTAVQSGSSTLPVPVVGDETSLALVKANPRDYVGRPFIVLGGINVWSGYQATYDTAQGTHVAMWLDEVRVDRTRTSAYILVYLRRDLSKPLVDAIAEAVAKGRTGKLIRAKLTFLPERYKDSDGANVAELLDWQFLDADGKAWGPWARGLETPPPKKAAAKTPAVKR